MYASTGLDLVKHMAQVLCDVHVLEQFLLRMHTCALSSFGQALVRVIRRSPRGHTLLCISIPTYQNNHAKGLLANTPGCASPSPLPLLVFLGR